MASLKSLTLAGAFALTSVLLAAGYGAAQAADLAMPPLESAPSAAEQPVEWGSGWYLRGDLAGERDATSPINANLATSSNQKSRNGMTADIGFGYKYNDWFRLDTTVSYQMPVHTNVTTGGITCQTSATPTYSTCQGNQTATRNNLTFMVNGYLDLGTWSGITPYIGAGVGLSHQSYRGAIAYVDTATTTSYTYLPWNRTDTSKGATHFAWALMGGVAIDVSDHTKLDIGAQYINMGSMSVVDSVTGLTNKKNLTSKGIKVGIRYMID